MIRKSVRQIATWPVSPRAFFAAHILILALAVTLSPAFAAAPSVRDVTKGNPRLVSLQIEIWPEYDRPAALVILKGEIAPDVPLPAAVSLRIAARSGGPAAVAYSTASSGNLLNLKYERNDAGEFIALNFDAPEPFFHIEYYDPVVTSSPGRSYTYVWTGDLAADRLSVVLQEPATASDVSVQPALDATAVGQDGLRYRSAQLGAFQAGKQLDVKVSYTKTDPRTSTEVLKPKVSTEVLTPNAPIVSPPSVAGPSKMELVVWLVAIVAVLVLGGIAASIWWYRRNNVSEAQPGGARFCGKCGAPSASDDRFCAKCGARLKKAAAVGVETQ